MKESAKSLLNVDLPQVWTRPKLSTKNVDLPQPWARPMLWRKTVNPPQPWTRPISSRKLKTYHNRGLGLCFSKKGKPTTGVDSVYALGKELDGSEKRHHLCGSFDCQFDKPTSPGKLAGCVCINVTTSGCRTFAFVTIAGGTKYTPRSESMAMKTAERRDFRHFRMQELDFVISKSRLGSGKREREIQLAQLCMQDLNSTGKKMFHRPKRMIHEEEESERT